MAGCKLAGCCWIAKIGKGKHKEEETNYIIVRRRRRTEGVRVKGRDEGLVGSVSRVATGQHEADFKVACPFC